MASEQLSRNDEGQQIVAAMKEYFETDAGKTSITVEPVSNPYLRNRIEAAFIAGWEARGIVSETGPIGEVAAERARQDEKWGGAEHDDGHETAVFVQLIEDYAGWARVMAGMNSPDKARRRLIQVAALAVAAVESIDRKEATNG